jgi:hypothetical protein
MNTRSLLLVIYLILFSIVTIQAQIQYLADSVKNRTEGLSSEELRMYPLSDIQHLLQMKSSVYFIQDNAVQTGLFIPNETFSLDGMPVRGIEYLPLMGYSVLGINRYNSLKDGFSPAGRFDFRTGDKPGGPFFKGEFSNSLYGLQTSVRFNKEVKKHEGDTRPIQLFLLGYAKSAKDGGPSFVDNVSINQETRDALQLHPYEQEYLYSDIFSTSFVGSEQTENSRFAKSTAQKDLKLYGKVIIPLGSRTLVKTQSLYSASKGKVDVFNNRLFNYMNNPDFSKYYFDGRISLDHELAHKEGFKLDMHLGIGYDNAGSWQGNDTYGKDFFKYCYIGSYFESIKPGYSYEEVGGEIKYIMNGFMTYGGTFEPNGLNSGLASYVTAMRDRYGEFFWMMDHYHNGFLPDNTASGWVNFDVPVSTYMQQQTGRKQVNGSMDAEIGKNKLTIGFEYRNEEYHENSIDVQRLLYKMDEYCNWQINQLDTDHPTETIIDGCTYVSYSRLYKEEDQTTFDRNLRTRLGLPVDGKEFIMVNSYNYENGTIQYYDDKNLLQTIKVDGNLFDLSLFGPEELLTITNSVGYDVYGKKVSHSHNPLSLLEDGAQTPYSPTNLALWVSYKRKISIINVSAGFRLERFDARQPVMADPLSLYKISTVSETPQLNHNSNAAMDWLVYTNSSYGNVVAYRDGLEWYMPDGGPATSTYLNQSEIRPFLADNDKTGLYKMNFIDYKPVINFLPSLELNLDLSREFYAKVSYNSYTRNPYNNRFKSASIYQFPMSSNPVIENMALKPERFDRMTASTGYMGSKGFSAILSGEFLRYRNAIQFTKVLFAFPKQYYSYENISEDIQIPTMELKLNYQRHWWEGGFVYSHTFLAKDMSVEELNKKKLLGIYIVTSRDLISSYAALKLHHTLEGLSLSTVWHYRGGTPYLIKSGSLLTGKTKSIQSSNDLDLKLLYIWNIGNGDLRMDFYIQVLNLINSRTIYSVYSNTGQPDDDGFLTDPKNQAAINSTVDPDAFRAQYALSLNNPAFYGQARSVWMGVTVSF